MKRNLIYFLIISLLAVALYALLQRKEEDKQTEAKTAKPQKKIEGVKETVVVVESPNLTEEEEEVLGGYTKFDKVRIRKENKRLIESLFGAIEESDGDGFKLALWRFITRYKADPFPIYEKLIPLLNHPNKGIRHALAEKFIVIGYEREKAATTLLELLNDESIKPIELQYPVEIGGEKYKWDRRKEIADFLTKYRVEEAKDAIWKAYQQTQNRSYIHNLAIFRDERALEGAFDQVRNKRKTYFDFVEIFGMFKVQEAREPLEKVYQARLQRGYKDVKLPWALYQITGEQQYYDFLMEKEFFVNNTFFEVPEVLQTLKHKLKSNDGTDIRTRTDGRRAFLSLLARGEEGKKIIEDYLVETFDEKIKTPIVMTTRHRVAASLNTEKLNAAAQRYEDKYTTQSWIFYKYQKGWPINDLISGYAY